MVKIKRFFELDALRGTAIVGMIGFHFLFDLDFFNIYNIGITAVFWQNIAKAIAATFILISGICLTISFEKNNSFRKFLQRGTTLFALGLIITIASFAFIPKAFIIFGILHFFGIATILAYPFLKMNGKNPERVLFFGIFAIVFGILLQNFRFDFSFLLWLGFLPENFATVDYFPVFPWIGVLLIGVFFGKKLYDNGKRKFELKELDFFQAKALQFLGKNSLAIYFSHQIILLAIINLFWGKGLI